MKLSDAKQAYEELSGKASDLVRQLGFAGIALIWLFRSGDDKSPLLEAPLLHAAFFVFLALSFDFLQYLTGATTWYLYFRHKEKQNTGPEDEFQAPVRINWPTWAMFGAKCVCVLVSYGAYLVPFLWGKFVA